MAKKAKPFKKKDDGDYEGGKTNDKGAKNKRNDVLNTKKKVKK